MKKTLLLLSAFFIAGFANGQAVRTVGSPSVAPNYVMAPAHASPGHRAIAHAGSAARTTVAGGRWYDYVDDILANNTFTAATCGGTAVSEVGFTSFNLWNDTTAIFGYDVTSGSPYAANDLTSVGLGFDPYDGMDLFWNNPSIFTSTTMYIPSGTSYSIDSVAIGYWYGRNPAKPSVVDTLILSFVTSGSDMGSYYFDLGSAPYSDYCVSGTDTFWFAAIGFDSIDNRAGDWTSTAITPVTTYFKIPLTAADGMATDSINAGYYRTMLIQLPSSITVSPASISAMSLSYKSGDPSYPTTLMTTGAFAGRADTINYSNGDSITAFKYNDFSVIIGWSGSGTGSSEAPVFPPYDYYYDGDLTCGYFMEQNSSSQPIYSPNWSWSNTSGGAYYWQYPYISYHVECASCPTIGSPALGVQNVNENKFNVYPNPANDELNFEFNTTQIDTKITLTNMLGQVVATQRLTGNNAVFSTSTLAEGIYVYSVQSNGAVKSGQVVIAH